MKVVRAAYAGACYGVQRALDLAQHVVEEGGCVYTLGPLIHNPQVVSELEARGARVVAETEKHTSSRRRIRREMTVLFPVPEGPEIRISFPVWWFISYLLRFPCLWPQHGPAPHPAAAPRARRGRYP